MERVNEIDDKSLYVELHKVARIGNEAVKKAKEENKRFGIPEFFYKNGIIYYELENGELTTEIPKIFQD